MIENFEQLEARKAELMDIIENPEANLEEVESEINALEARAKELIEEKRTAIEQIANSNNAKIIEKLEVKKDMDIMEMRNSNEYAKAYATYMLKGDETEMRSLLSENVTSNYFPMPKILSDKIAHAWEKAKLFDGVTITSIKGNIRTGFEITATGANIHTEGAEAPDEETISLGVEEVINKSIKKWISVSTELMDIEGDKVMEYLYTEFASKIVKKAQETLIADIIARPSTSSTSKMGVKVYTLTGEPTREDIIMAKALLSDEASDNLAFIANKSQIAKMKATITADGYALANPFDDCVAVADSTIATYASASSDNAVGIIVDKEAILCNKPNGDELKFTIDELSLAEDDLVKVVGRELVALGLKAPYTAVILKK